jgi:N-acetylmuramate 1-kinase
VISREEMLRFAGESLGLAGTVHLEITALGGRGSDRVFYRVRWGEGNSAILVNYDPVRIENSYYADIALFLNDAGIPVPGLMGHDPLKCLVVMEDLGDQDLWSLRDAPWKIRGEAYRTTLSAVARLHAIPERGFPSGRIRLMEPFGPDLYRWEQDYFFTHFVRDWCRVFPGPDQLRDVEEELSSLGTRLDSSGRCLVHRDLQSQNVMVRNGSPFFIDFQGMRFGSPFYDLGSLLCDPYAELSDEEQQELRSFYREVSGTEFDAPLFESLFWEASAQRLMQALGAYGFLGLKKGLKPFLNHIPSGLRNLRKAVKRAGTLPQLEQVLRLCG